MAIPPKEQMTGNNTSEAQFKSGMNNIVDYLGDVDAQSLTFGTTAELKLAKPKIGQKAKTLDSGKVWEWKGIVGWVDTGEGELDRAKEDATLKVNALMSTTAKTIEDYAFVVADEDNNVGLGLEKDGSFEVAGAKHEATGTASEIVWGVGDESGQVPLAQLSNGNTLIAGVEHESAKVSATVDEGGSAVNVIKDGVLYQTEAHVDELHVSNLVQKIISTYEEDGNIFIVDSGEATQITFDGLNRSPVFASDRVIFLSKKQRGAWKQYQHKDGVISRYYPQADLAKYVQVIITGQSLAEGAANPALDNRIVDDVFRIGGNAVVGQWGANLSGDIAPLQDLTYETISTGFATQLNQKGVLVSGCARGGTDYARLKKGAEFNIFENCISQVDLVNHADKNSFVPAVFAIHGEADGNKVNTEYDKNLREWLDDFNNEIRKVKGSSSAVMITCQTSSASGYKSLANRDQFTTPFLQLKASNENPDIFLVCPKYQYAYKDYAHVFADDTRHLGEMYAKVYRKVVINGEDWKPLQPTKFIVKNNQIIVDFHVPVEPLQFDTDIITSVANQGFELTKADSVAITDVQITSANQVTITCSADVPVDAVLSYAFYNGTTASTSGRAAGSRGTLKDSDNTQDKFNYMPLNNWCVTFKQTLN